MSRWIKLSYLLQDTTRFGDASRLFVDYEVLDNKLGISKGLTGWDDNQTIKTERNLGFHPIIDKKGNTYLISHSATKYCLGLSGRTGYENGEELICKISEMYSNFSASAIGMGLTEELFDQIPEHLKYVFDTYWLSSRCRTNNRGLVYYGYVFVGYASKHKIDLYADKHIFYARNAIRPLIALPQNMMVCVGDKKYNGLTKENALKIRLQTY